MGHSPLYSQCGSIFYVFSLFRLSHFVEEGYMCLDRRVLSKKKSTKKPRVLHFNNKGTNYFCNSRFKQVLLPKLPL